MKIDVKIIILAITAFIGITVTANAQTKIEIGLAGDAYYATDNDKSVELDEERQFTNTNIYRDRFGINNTLLNATVTSDDWRANFAIGTFGDLIQPEEANIGLRLFEGLWITGGVFANWDNGYTFEKWFTGNSLTDIRNVGSPYVAWGLEYAFNEDITLGAGLMNVGFIDIFDYGNNTNVNFETNNNKSIYAILNWNDLYKDWKFTISLLTGKDGEFPVGKPDGTHDGMPAGITRTTEIYTSLEGTIWGNLEGQIFGKFFRDDIKDNPEIDALNFITFQTLLRYRFHEKFSAGARFSYLSADEPDKSKSSGIDLGIVCEYNPTPFTYLRLEGGMLSLSNSENNDDAKVFWNGNENISSRLSIAVSMGFRFSLFEKEIK